MTIARDLYARITDTITRKHLFKQGDTLIIGVSGGADSTALLDLLATLPSFPLCLVAAHLNHCLREFDSDADEQFCRDLASHYKIPFESRRVEVMNAASDKSLNLEDAGRRARIIFFNELYTKWQATAVVLAHHADDQAETVLMRLLRGAGMTGLSGMSYCNENGYVRPMLNFKRTEIEAYLISRNLSWREDTSNRDTTLLRNSIRHELLPILERYNPSVRTALTTAAGILSEEDALLNNIALQAIEKICRFSNTVASCNIILLKSYPTAMQRRIIRMTLQKLAGDLNHITHRHLENILNMAFSKRPNLRTDLPKGLLAIKEYNSLIIKAKDESESNISEITITGPGRYQLSEGVILAIDVVLPPLVHSYSPPGTAFFDCDRVPFPWHIRKFSPGDRIQPLGMSGRKKVKDIFIDEKIPLARRLLIPLVFHGNELIWIVGLRISHLARVDTFTSKVVSAVILNN